MENKKQDKYAAQMRYDAKNVIRITLKLNKKTDKDILERLDNNKPLATQLKHFIRSGIDRT